MHECSNVGSGKYIINGCAGWWYQSWQIESPLLPPFVKQLTRPEKCLPRGNRSLCREGTVHNCDQRKKGVLTGYISFAITFYLTNNKQVWERWEEKTKKTKSSCRHMWHNRKMSVCFLYSTFLCSDHMKLNYGFYHDGREVFIVTMNLLAWEYNQPMLYSKAAITCV